MSICDLRLNTGRDGTTEFGNLKSKFLLSPGSPWRVRPRIQRRRPRDQRRNFKTRCGLGINTKAAILQTAYGVEAGLWPASLERIRDMKIHVPLIALSLLALAVRGATAADTGLAPCRPRPHFLDRPQSLFRSSSAECQSTLKSVTRQP